MAKNSDVKFINLVAIYEQEMCIPEHERSTRYSKQWNSYIVKDEASFEKAKQIRDEALKAIGKTIDDFAFDDSFADVENIRKALESVTKPKRLQKEKFDVVEIFGKPVLFTGERLNSSDLPKGLYKYDIRHDDDGRGDIVQLKNYVTVNHWGTVMCKEPFDITQTINGRELTTAEGIDMTEDDYAYTGESMTIEEYANAYMQLITENENEQTQEGQVGMCME